MRNKENWLCHPVTAKTRFECEKCKNTWSTGYSLFQFMIQEEDQTTDLDKKTTIKINVIVRVWKQICKRCGAHGLNIS